MNDRQWRALKKNQKMIRAQNAMYGKSFAEIPREEWPVHVIPDNIIRLYRSRDFMVQVYLVPGHENLIRLSIHRTEADSTGNFKDGITWDQLQKIKNEIGYADNCAVEIFPPADDLVYDSNIRHLWVFKNSEALTFMWRNPK